MGTTASDAGMPGRGAVPGTDNGGVMFQDSRSQDFGHFRRHNQHGSHRRALWGDLPHRRRQRQYELQLQQHRFVLRLLGLRRPRQSESGRAPHLWRRTCVSVPSRGSTATPAHFPRRVGGPTDTRLGSAARGTSARSTRPAPRSPCAMVRCGTSAAATDNGLLDESLQPGRRQSSACRQN